MTARGTAVTVPEGESFQLAVAQSAAVGGEGLTVRFVRVTEESRCPSDVQCIRAGEARILLELRLPRSEPDDAILATEGAQPRYASIGAYDVHLVRLDPVPRTSVSRPAYLATLRVVRH